MASRRHKLSPAWRDAALRKEVLAFLQRVGAGCPVGTPASIYGAQTTFVMAQVAADRPREDETKADEVGCVGVRPGFWLGRCVATFCVDDAGRIRADG